MMKLRTATTRDLHRLTEITTSSLIDDPTYDYLYPGRKRFPEDNSTWMRLRLEKLLYEKRATFLVVEIDGDTGTSEKQTTDAILEHQQSIIISYGIWIRMGNDSAAKERFGRKNTWLNVVDAMSFAVSDWSISQKYSRRDADPARLSAKASTFEAFKRTFFGDSPEWWSLELLVTHREYRRRGAATQIVKWGTTQADLEHVACGIEASPMGTPLYKSLGFRTLATWTIKVPDDDVSLDEQCMRRDAQ